MREKAAKTLCIITSKHDPSIEKDILLNIDEFYYHQEDQLDQVIAEEKEKKGGVSDKGGGASEKVGGANEKGGGDKAGPTKKERMERSLLSFGKDLVRLLQKEGSVGVVVLLFSFRVVSTVDSL